MLLLHYVCSSEFSKDEKKGSLSVSAEVTFGNRGTLKRWEPSYLLVELLVHQQVRLGPASEEPHDVFPHLWAQEPRQARSGRPGLHLRRPQHCRQQPGTEEEQLK